MRRIRPPAIEGIDLRIKRAKVHLKHLEGREAGFIHVDKPYETVSYDDPNTGEAVYQFLVHKPVPPLISLLAGETIHNLRVALDYLAFALVKPRGKAAVKACSFPFVEERKDLEGALKGLHTKIAKTSPVVVADKAVDLIRRTKPYRRANKGCGLYVLHDLDIRDKHRLLLAGGAGFTGMDCKIPVFSVEELRAFYRKVNAGFSLHHRKEFLRLPAQSPSNAEAYKNVKFAFHVAFREPRALEGEPIVPTLEGLVNLVEGIVKPFRPLL